MSEGAPDLAHRDARGRWCSEGRALLFGVVRRHGKQSIVASILGVDVRRVCDWCSGRRRPEWEDAVVIERRLGIACINWGIGPLRNPRSADRLSLPADDEKRSFTSKPPRNAA